MYMYEVFVCYFKLLKLGASSKRRKLKLLLDRRKQRKFLGKRQKIVLGRSRKQKAGMYVLLKRNLATMCYIAMFL